MREWCKGQGLAVAVEYVEPGASATDDRRPVFQQMISEATLSPSPYEAIIVHSRSRFFRDLFHCLGYERTLKRAGVKVLSITQQTSDDSGGEMARTMFSLFDEFQSKENSKHTLRAMQENARQGYSNGSKPPFGYRAVEAEGEGRRGGHRPALIRSVPAWAQRLTLWRKEHCCSPKRKGSYLTGAEVDQEQGSSNAQQFGLSGRIRI
jgi:DNA invertase Pin-like site-specific DNA recombinase